MIIFEHILLHIKAINSRSHMLTFILKMSNFDPFHINLGFLPTDETISNSAELWFFVNESLKSDFYSWSWVLWIFRVITTYNKLIQTKIKRNLQFLKCMSKTDTDFWSYVFCSWTRFLVLSIETLLNRLFCCIVGSILGYLQSIFDLIFWYK